MPNHIRRFMLPPQLVADLDQVTENRSAAMRAALATTAEGVELLAFALHQRINARRRIQIDRNTLTLRGKEKSIPITVSWDVKSDQLIDQLVAVSQLPAEQVVRLAVEAHIAALRTRSPGIGFDRSATADSSEGRLVIP